MNKSPSQLDRAIQWHQSGKITEAMAQYQRMLSKQKNNAQLLYLLGTACLQIGQAQQGITHLKRSLSIAPKNPEALNNLGVAFLGLKQLDEALACYDQALAIQVHYVDAHNNRGNVLKALKRMDEALASYDRALALQPHHVEAHNNRGNALKEMGQLDEALASYDQALSIRPDYVQAHLNRGNVFKELRRFDEALASYDRALAIDPNLADAYNNRGMVLKDLRRMDEALASYDRALTLRPNHAQAFLNRGNALKDLRRLDEALASYDQAITLEPSYAEAHWNKALILLLTGHYLQGWALSEWRLQKDEAKNLGIYNHAPRLAWRGQEDLRGQKLLIHLEQGLGDFIQCSRYLPLLADMGIELIVQAPQALLRWMASLKCPMTLVPQGSPLPAFDAYCPVMSLPYVFKTTLETIPAETPYLYAEPEKVQAWHACLGPRQKLRVGLVWSGQAAHKNDHNRSLQLEQLQKLLALPGIEWHSLQKEYRQSDADALKKYACIHHHQDALHDFADTAALIECMDLVISIDTSVAHAAGALGKSVWILLHDLPDYRWLLDRSDSPWYPSARLYRQPQPDDWESVLRSVENDLIQKVQSHIRS